MAGLVAASSSAAHQSSLLLPRFRSHSPKPHLHLLPLTIGRSRSGSVCSAIRFDSQPNPISQRFSISRAFAPDSSDGGGGGGSGGGGGGGDRGENSEGGEEEGSEKRGGMSMSQKLTLGYAALVGIGGVMGYVKGGSQKSLAAGGGSALLLYYVYTQLPTSPVMASAIGMGLSAALLVVMGSRFKKSGKVFPAGVVSVVSLVMTGGYLHGILRSMH